MGCSACRAASLKGAASAVSIAATISGPNMKRRRGPAKNFDHGATAFQWKWFAGMPRDIAQTQRHLDRYEGAGLRPAASVAHSRCRSTDRPRRASRPLGGGRMTWMPSFHRPTALPG